MNLESLLVCRDAEVVRVLRPTLEKLSIEVEVSAAARSGADAVPERAGTSTTTQRTDQPD